MPTEAGALRLRIAAGAIAVAGVMAALALPRVAAYMSVTSWRSFSTIVPDVTMPAEAVEEARIAYATATGWLPGDASLWEMEGRIALLPGGAGAKDADAVRFFRNALEDAPANAHLWAMLGYAQSRSDVPGAAVPSLRLSCIMGPSEAYTGLIRLDVTLPHWDAMPDDLRNCARHDIRRVWVSGLWRQLAQLYLASSFQVRVTIRDAALLSPEEVGYFDGELRKVAGRPLLYPPKKH